ncbi:MAG: M28 family peptidase [Pedobacter sp.]|nr:MAG: M28 family peptidase [Pedobacter sp.]
MKNRLNPFKYAYVACFIASSLFACIRPNSNTKDANTGANPAESEHSYTDAVPALPAVEFNADSAYAFVKAQVDFGPRIPSTAAHAACANYLQQKLKSYGASVFVQTAPIKTYDGKTHQLKNIIAAIAPEKAKRILISAHWDTRPFSDQDPDHNNHEKTFDGANDGGSGVAVILEMARQIQLKQPEVGVDFILWDIEDYGNPNGDGNGKTSYCLGSQYWAKNMPVKGYKPLYAINLDMVGGENAQFTMEEYSRQFAPQVVDKVWGIAEQLGYNRFFLPVNSSAIMDDHYWMNKAGIPTIDIIHFSDAGFYSNWHTQFDNLAHIDKNALNAVGRVVMTAIYNEK